MTKRPETEREKEMFEYYWILGDNRKLTTIAKHFGCSYDTLKKTSARLEWSERLVERDLVIRKETDRRLANKIAKDLEKRYDQMSHIADNSFKNLKMKSFRDFKDYIETALKLKGESQKFEVGTPGENLIQIVIQEESIDRKVIEATTSF